MVLSRKFYNILDRYTIEWQKCKKIIIIINKSSNRSLIIRMFIFAVTWTIASYTLISYNVRKSNFLTALHSIIEYTSIKKRRGRNSVVEWQNYLLMKILLELQIVGHNPILELKKKKNLYNYWNFLTSLSNQKFTRKPYFASWAAYWITLKLQKLSANSMKKKKKEIAFYIYYFPTYISREEERVEMAHRSIVGNKLILPISSYLSLTIICKLSAIFRWPDSTARVDDKARQYIIFSHAWAFASSATFPRFSKSSRNWLLRRITHDKLYIAVLFN